MKSGPQKNKELCRYFERCVLGAGGKIEQAQYGPDDRPVGHIGTFKNIQLPTANALSLAFMNLVTKQTVDKWGIFHVSYSDYDSYKTGDHRVVVDTKTKIGQVQVLIETETNIYWDIVEQLDLAELSYQALVR